MFVFGARVSVWPYSNMLLSRHSPWLSQLSASDVKCLLHVLSIIPMMYYVPLDLSTYPESGSSKASH